MSATLTHAPPSSPDVTLLLPFVLTSPGTARGRLSDFLRLRRIDERFIDDAVLVMSELVANAVRHSRPRHHEGAIIVDWCVGDNVLTVSVADGGTTTELHAELPDVRATNHRGLAIVAALSDHWWVDRGRSGTTVHAQLRVA